MRIRKYCVFDVGDGAHFLLPTGSFDYATLFYKGNLNTIVQSVTLTLNPKLLSTLKMRHVRFEPSAHISSFFCQFTSFLPSLILSRRHLFACLSLIPILWRDKFFLAEFLRPKLSGGAGITLSVEVGRRNIISFRVIIDKCLQAACVEDGSRALGIVFGSMFADSIRVAVRERQISGSR